MTPIDPESIKAAADAAHSLGGPAAAAYAAKKLADPMLDGAALVLREWTERYVTPRARRMLRLEDAAELAQKLAAEKLANVPTDRLVEPNPSIVAGTIEALQTAHEQTELRELFAQLLASTMDGAIADAAHPSFVEIIRQMGSDDARVFRAMERCAPYYYLSESIAIEFRHAHQAERERLLVTAWQLLGKDAGVPSPLRVAYALTNLERLGLVERHIKTYTTVGGDTKPVQAAVDVTMFGKRFAVACLGVPAPVGLGPEWTAPYRFSADADPTQDRQDLGE
jgi:hypothetical protein